MPDTRYAGERIIASVENARAPFTVNATIITANTPDPSQSAETVWATTPSLTFRSQRAYRITAKGLANSNTAGTDIQIRIRKTGLGGLIMYDSFRVSTPAATNYGFIFSNIVVNATGSDITAPIVGTVSRAAGTGLVTVAASVVSPAYLQVEDVGPAGDFSGATALS